jgi:hypothetical protein
MEQINQSEESMQTNILFFLCVWMAPMLLFLKLDPADDLMSDFGILSRIQGFIWKIDSAGERPVSVVRRLSQSSLSSICE